MHFLLSVCVLKRMLQFLANRRCILAVSAICYPQPGFAVKRSDFGAIRQRLTDSNSSKKAVFRATFLDCAFAVKPNLPARSAGNPTRPHCSLLAALAYVSNCALFSKYPLAY